jgi:hypothetical protein
LFVLPAYAKYSGGSGTAQDHYQIATAADLMALGETLEDYDKHFILTADIDLDPKLPGRKVFDKAVIGADFGISFYGVLDGKGHTISHLTIRGDRNLGLFGVFGGEVTDLGVVNVNIVGSDRYIGALVGCNCQGTVTRCYSTGAVSGSFDVGGLVGGSVSSDRPGPGGTVAECGTVAQCYSTAVVTGEGGVGGLVGHSEDTVTQCYSTGSVTGHGSVGGLVGYNEGGTVTQCYSTGAVSGTGLNVGGLVGGNYQGTVTASFWDTQTSGQAKSDRGIGKTTAQMQAAKTFLDAGWDFVGETANGTSHIWQMPQGGGYPVLTAFSEYTPPQLKGLGTPADPYLVSNAVELGAMVHYSPYAHYRLTASIDLSGIRWGTAVVPWFAGTFDGDGHTVSHLTIQGASYLGLFGRLEHWAEVKNLGVVDVNLTGGSFAGGLVGYNDLGSTVTRCYSTGTVSGTERVGGLVGGNGWYSTVIQCYSIAAVNGTNCVGGLAGGNYGGTATQCYSTGIVSGQSSVGGLLGSDTGVVTACFWDTQTAGQAKSAAGTGKTTAQMQAVKTFLDAGWDFVGEIANGTSQIWQMGEGGGYPVLAVVNGYGPPRLQGSGTPGDPYLIADAIELGAMVHYSSYAHFRLTASIDLSGIRWGTAVIPWFAGTFDGSSLTISHLTIRGGSDLGLFGQSGPGTEVKDLGVVDVNITGSGDDVGGVVGNNNGAVTQCYSTGSVNGTSYVGGLMGNNTGCAARCYSTAAVSGTLSVGGLLGSNEFGTVTQCYSTGSVSGQGYVGGLAGINLGTMTYCYSTGVVRGTSNVGGLVGSSNLGFVLHGIWDIQTSGLSESAGGVGLTTAHMMDNYMLGLNGFANDPNWVLDAGRDYPRLTWEGRPGQIIPKLSIDWLDGGGTAENPYRIDTADQLILLGKCSILWDKHLVLTADIDLDPKLRNGEVFPQAVIPVFLGVFDGNDHTISHLTVKGATGLGLFGRLASGAKVRDLGVAEIKITGSGRYIGGLAGYNSGDVTTCYSTGTVSSTGGSVGGLVGQNDHGSVTRCRSTSAVSGDDEVGGLVAWNDQGTVTQCYSSGAVTGGGTGQYSGIWVGGLVGRNGGPVTHCFSTGTVRGSSCVGGLVGLNGFDSAVTQCYSTSTVSGTGEKVGGLVGENWRTVTACFWNTQTSGQATSAGGAGKATAEMQTAKTFLDAGWDFVGETVNGSEDIWKISDGLGYPRLSWERYSGGSGTAQDPYQIATAADLIALGNEPNDYDKHFVLTADIDLDPKLARRKVFDKAVIAPGANWWFDGTPFAGVFDGKGHTVSNLTINGKDYLGLFGYLASGAEVKNQGVVDVNVVGSDTYIGGLVGYNCGSIAASYSTGTVTGDGEFTGGLVGLHLGSAVFCYSTSVVRGRHPVAVGGLVGANHHVVDEGPTGSIAQCYSTGAVSVSIWGGGLMGGGPGDAVTGCFWDTQTSGRATSAGGTGKTTAEMQTAKTFLDAGWDFVGETKNGTVDVWWILEGKGYPRLWWELTPRN